MAAMKYIPSIPRLPPILHQCSRLVPKLVNTVVLFTGDEDLGEEGGNGEADDADLDDDWGLDNE